MKYIALFLFSVTGIFLLTGNPPTQGYSQSKRDTSIYAAAFTASVIGEQRDAGIDFYVFPDTPSTSFQKLDSTFSDYIQQKQQRLVTKYKRDLRLERKSRELLGVKKTVRYESPAYAAVVDSCHCDTVLITERRIPFIKRLTTGNFRRTLDTVVVR